MEQQVEESRVLKDIERLSRSTGVPTMVIQPSHGLLTLKLGELWRYRELLYFLAWRDVRIRYKQAVLGFLWAFIQPLLKMVVFSVVFGGLARMDSEGFPYPIFLYAGLLPWEFFASAVNRSGQSIIAGANLITKVYFPRLIMPVASVGACLVDFAISFGILIAMMFYFQITPGVSILMVLPLVSVTILCALGIGVFVSALNTAYRDFRYALPFLVQIWMYVTPVIYPVTIIPENWRWLMALNPMSGIVDAYRSAILGKPFDWPHLGISFGIATIMFLIGLLYFRKTERYFADIV